MIEFYLMIALVVVAFMYMGHKALKTYDLSSEIIDLDARMDRLECEVFECFKIVREDMPQGKDEMRRIMTQDIGAMWDEHLSSELKKHEESREPVYFVGCCKCGEKLHEGDEAYEIDDCYYCEDCISDYKITLEGESE